MRADRQERRCPIEGKEVNAAASSIHDGRTAGTGGATKKIARRTRQPSCADQADRGQQIEDNGACFVVRSVAQFVGRGNDPQIGTEELRALLVKAPPVTPDPALDPDPVLGP